MERDPHADADHERRPRTRAQVIRSVRPRRRCTSISRPARNSRNASPISAQDLNRLIDLHPAEAGGPDHDPGDDLEHHRGKTQPRHQPERERRRERDRDDDQEVREVGLCHVAAVPQRPASLQQPVGIGCNALVACVTERHDDNNA